jgi:hypothetical protein
MLDFLRSTSAQVVIWLTVLTVLCVIGLYFVRRVRDQSGEGEATANDLLTRFREMEEGGQISQAEFRQIRSVLGPKIHDKKVQEKLPQIAKPHQKAPESKDREGDG